MGGGRWVVGAVVIKESELRRRYERKSFDI